MIVKKIPILQGFPDICTVKKLSNYAPELSDISPLFYDIETTGLSRRTASVYLIGAVVREDHTWQLYQWFAQRPEDEEEVLRAFSEFIHPFSCNVQYNGNSFDQPFLISRCEKFGLPDPFAGKSALDLYRTLKPLKGLLKLPAMKQPDLEAFLGYTDRLHPDGGACIRLYKSYVRTRDEALLSEILGHNQEDLLGLGKILHMLGYLCLYQKDYDLEGTENAAEQLLFKLQLPVTLPMEFSAGGDRFYITGQAERIRVLVTPKNGCLRRFYENFRDYDYIPGEDTAIPKALSAFMDKGLRKPASPETCYTWFPINEDFLSDRKKQADYIAHALPAMLRSLV